MIIVNVFNSRINKLTADNFAARLKQANLGNKNDILDFVKKTHFDEKPKNYNKNVTSKKRHIEVNKKLDDLEEKFKQTSTKGVTKDLIINYSTLNVGKYFAKID